MRPIAAMLIAICAVEGATARADATSSSQPKSADARKPYPVEVALLKDPRRGWTYRQFPTNAPLYVSDTDQNGRSNCNDGCASRWVPLLAAEGSKALGAWRPIRRSDHRLQWAYKGRPIYTLVHDSVDSPIGDGIENGWHLLAYFK